MPLDRSHVTIASRVMLWVYPAFAAAVAASFLFTPHARLRATPALRAADDLLGLRLWGAGFAVVAGLLLAALVIRRRVPYVAALGVMASWMLLYAGMVLESAIHGQSSWSAWTWPAFIAAACWASMLSLLSRET